MAELEEREPDPNGWVPNDEEGLVLVESNTEASGDSLRIELMLKPNAAIGAHWNNEAGPTQLWLEPPEGWTLTRQLQAIPNPPADVSDEPRAFHAELAGSGDAILRGYAVYFVCEGETGVCMSRRQTVEVPLAELTS